MGLCKCRTVTNLFCYRHKKNVCEKCIVQEHTRCIVRSYLQWLQDSDYENVCQICKTTLDNGTLIRLTCLDLFHLDCLNKEMEKLPSNTAGAGYLCPTCLMPVMPRDNTITQIATQIRNSIKDFSWAKPHLPLNANGDIEVRVDLDKNNNTFSSLDNHNNNQQSNSSTSSSSSSSMVPPPRSFSLNDSENVYNNNHNHNNGSRLNESKLSIRTRGHDDDDKYGKAGKPIDGGQPFFSCPYNFGPRRVMFYLCVLSFGMFMVYLMTSNVSDDIVGDK